MGVPSKGDQRLWVLDPLDSKGGEDICSVWEMPGILEGNLNEMVVGQHRRTLDVPRYGVMRKYENDTIMKQPVMIRK